MYTLQPPNSGTIERYILGCLVLDKKDSIVKISENDFYDKTNQTIFKCLKYMTEKNKNIDIISVSDLLAKKIEDSLQLITAIVSDVPTTANFDSILDDLRKYTVKRQLLAKTTEIQEMILKSEHDHAIDLKSDVLQSIDNIEVTEKNIIKNDMTSIVFDLIQDIDDRYNSKEEQKLYTGFTDLDRFTAGLHKQEMTIIAARPGVGKTAFALQLMIHLAKKKNNCLFISREMSTIQIAKRILANVAGIDGHKLRTCKALNDDDFINISRATSFMSELPIELNEKIKTVQEIRAYCRELKTKNKLDILFLDYIGLMQTMKKCDNRRLEIEDISRQLKEISLEFKIPVIVLAQLNREGAKAGREPEMHDLKESGSIEQDADNVMFLHVPKDTNESDPSFEIKLILAKQRNGPTGYIYLKYFKNTFKFYSKG